MAVTARHFDGEFEHMMLPLNVKLHEAISRGPS